MLYKMQAVANIVCWFVMSRSDRHVLAEFASLLWRFCLVVLLVGGLICVGRADGCLRYADTRRRHAPRTHTNTKINHRPIVMSEAWIEKAGFRPVIFPTGL